MIVYFFYGSGMYRKHPNHTYGRNQNNSANNQAIDRRHWQTGVQKYGRRQS